MATITACFIAKNEGKRLGKCLDSIDDIVDEFVVVDTGSTDNTKEVAYRYTNKVYDFKWINDFSAARNFSFSKATGDWIIWLDCDDWFREPDRQKFKKLKATLDDSNYDAYDFWYNYRHNEEGVCTYRFQRDRLIRNHKGYHWEYPVHELLVIDGAKICMTDITVTHRSNHDNGEKYIKFFEEKMAEGYELTQRDMYYYGGELSIFGYREKSKKVFEKFFSLGEHNNSYEAKRACEYLFNIYLSEGEYLKALETEFRYLKYASPDPKIFFKIGFTYDKLGRENDSIFFYKISADMKNTYVPDESTGFDESQFIFESALELSCKLFYKNKYQEAKHYHEVCKELKPDNSTVIYNDKFFKE